MGYLGSVFARITFRNKIRKVKTMPKFTIEWKKNNSSKRKKFATVESVPEAIRLISKNCRKWINETPAPYFRVHEKENERIVDYGSHTAKFIISEVKET